MQYRKEPLVSGSVYHVYSRSIAKYVIFNNAQDFNRLINILDLYRFNNFNFKYSRFLNLDKKLQAAIINEMKKSGQVDVQIIAYCLMPTHIHLILKQITDKGISNFMAKTLNCYTRYHNIKFKSVLVKSDEQLLHLSRYIHLNPTSAGLVKKPQDWDFSSYQEYLGQSNLQLCSFDGLFDFTPKQYQEFVNDRKSYQKNLSIIRKIIIEDYAG